MNKPALLIFFDQRGPVVLFLAAPALFIGGENETLLVTCATATKSAVVCY